MSGGSLECRSMNAGDGLLTRVGRRSGRSAAASETAHGRSGAQRARRHMAVLGLKAVWRAEEMPQLAVWTGPATERNRGPWSAMGTPIAGITEHVPHLPAEGVC